MDLFNKQKKGAAADHIGKKASSAPKVAPVWEGSFLDVAKRVGRPCKDTIPAFREALKAFSVSDKKIYGRWTSWRNVASEKWPGGDAVALIPK